MPTASMSAYFLRQQKRGSKKSKRASGMEQVSLQSIEHCDSPSVQSEIREFCLYGKLKHTHTEVHNTLPSREVITRERELTMFEETRKKSPHEVMYKEFYQYLSPAVSPNYLPGFATPQTDQPLTRTSTRYLTLPGAVDTPDSEQFRPSF